MGGLFAWAQLLPTGGLYAFIFVWLFVESTGFPISDEPLLLLTGYLALRGRVDLVAAIAVALIGKVSASCAAYWVGHRIDLLSLARPATRPTQGLQRWLYYVRPTATLVRATQQWVRTQGVWGVFVGRLIPIVRSFISYPAGAARMSFDRFLLATTAGSLIWIATWTLLGTALGKSYEVAARRWGMLSWLVLVAFCAALAALWLWSHRRVGRTARATDSRQAAQRNAHTHRTPER
jgi:membrane protein DedA with SNARE-associated domain